MNEWKTGARRAWDRIANAAMATAESLERRTLFAAVDWTGASGDGLWTTPGNWSTHELPGPQDDVTIDVADHPTVTLSDSDQAVRSLLTAENVSLFGATLTVTSGVTLAEGAAISLGHSATGVSDLRFLNGEQTLGGQGEVVFDTLLGSADRNLLTPVASTDQPATLTIDAGVTVRNGNGSGQIGTDQPNTFVVNKGSIFAKGPGTLIEIASAFRNQGSLNVAGGMLIDSVTGNLGSVTIAPGFDNELVLNGVDYVLDKSLAVPANARLFLNGHWSNQATLSTNGGVINFGGVFTKAGLGSFHRLGGQVNLVGVLSGGLSLNTGTGSWTLDGGELLGGTYAANPGSTLTVKNGTLDGVTLASNLTIGGGASLTVVNSLTFAKGAKLALAADQGGDSAVRFAGGPQTLGGDGAVVFDGDGTNHNLIDSLQSDGGEGTLTIAPGVTIQTGSGDGRIGTAGPMSIVNQGVIVARNAGRAIRVDAALVNAGSLRVAAGATLEVNDVNGNLDNATLDGGGTLIVGGNYALDRDLNVSTDATLTLNGDWTNQAVLSLDHGTLNLGGDFTQAGLGVFHRSEGTVNLTGALNDGLSLNAATGSWNLAGGTLRRGIYTVADGAELIAIRGNLDDVSLSSNFTLNNATIGVNHDLTLLNGVRLTLDQSAGGISQLAFGDGRQTFGGQGEVVFDGDGTNHNVISVNRANPFPVTLTIGAGVTIRNGSGDGDLGSQQTPAPIVNNGTILAQGAQRTINTHGAIVNQGTIQVEPEAALKAFDSIFNVGVITATGATLSLGGNWSNAGTLRVVDTTLNLGGSFTQADLGAFFRTGGTVNLTGTLSGNLALDGRTGSWNMDRGSLLGSEVTAQGGAILTVTGSGKNVFNGVTLGTTIALNSASLTILNGLTFSYGSIVCNDGLVTLSGNELFGQQKLGGMGTIVFNGSNRSLLVASNGDSSPSTLVIGQFVTVRTGSGDGRIVAGSTLNQGTIAAIGRGRTITIDKPLTNDGTVRVGAGALVKANGIVDSFTQTRDGRLIVEIGGTPSGVEFGKLMVGSNFKIDGVLEIVKTNHFSPTAGARYQLMSFGSHTGDFAVFLGLSTPEGVALYTTDLQPKSFSLVATGEPIPGMLPAVMDLFVSGTSWTSSFLQAMMDSGLGDKSFGYRLSADPSRPLPWSGVDRVSIRFNEAVGISEGMLTIRGAQLTNRSLDRFTVDYSTYTATWTFAAPLDVGTVRLDLNGGWNGVMSSDTHVALDGEYAGAFPSGDGFAGGDFLFNLITLPGDVNGDGRVNAADLVQTRNRIGRSAQDPTGDPSAYSPLGDANGDGAINALDLVLVRNRIGLSLPSMLRATAWSIVRATPLFFASVNRADDLQRGGAL